MIQITFQGDSIFVYTQKIQQAISILSLRWFILLRFKQLLLYLSLFEKTEYSSQNSN